MDRYPKLNVLKVLPGLVLGPCSPPMHLQFDTEILDICLTILNSNPKFVSDADQDCSARRNPIYVTRVLSAMVGPPTLLKEGGQVTTPPPTELCSYRRAAL